MNWKTPIVLGLLALCGIPSAWATEADTYWLNDLNHWTPITTANPLPTTATLSGSITATTAGTAASAPAAVSAGTGKPFYLSLYSELFTTLSFGGTPLALGQGLMAASLPVVLASNQSAIPSALTFGGTPLALGQAAMAASMPVVLASNQASIPTAATPTFGGSPLALGQAVMASSMPVVIASDQSTLVTKPEAAIVPVISSAAEANHVLKNSAGSLVDLYITTSVTGYLLVYNLTAAPVDGAVTPQDCVAVPAGTTQSIITGGGRLESFTTGISAVFSTTGCFTQTSSATAFFHGRVL